LEFVLGEGNVIDLESRVESALDQLCRNPSERSWKNTGWTQRLKSGLIQLAHEAGYKAYASKAAGADGGEWLYDLTWLDYSTENRILRRAILLLESEWIGKQEERDWDFHKLLLARADLRVMVFQVEDEEQGRIPFLLTRAKCL
jgi:hypothetical protein